MTWVGELGLGLVRLAVLLVIAALGALLPRGLSFGRRLRETHELLAVYRQNVESERMQLASLAAEREELLRPLRSIRRVLLHPLTIALFESYRRRRARQTTSLA